MRLSRVNRRICAKSKRRSCDQGFWLRGWRDPWPAAVRVPMRRPIPLPANGATDDDARRHVAVRKGPAEEACARRIRKSRGGRTPGGGGGSGEKGHAGSLRQALGRVGRG